MKISKNSKLEKVLPKERVDPILLHPFLRVDGPGTGTLLASDKFSAVIIPVEVSEQDVSGQVHIEAVKASRKLGETVLCGEEHCIVQGGVAYPRDVKHKEFPPVDQLKVPDGKVVQEVSVNVKTLYALAQAMGTDVVTLRIPEEATPFVEVKPHLSEPHIEGAWGFLMKYRIPGSI